MRILGLDGGIASIGWAVLDLDDDALSIVAAGTWMFDAPETDKERTPTNAIRRQKRGQRRVIRRRHQRMAAVRQLFHQHRLLEAADRDALRLPDLDPWQLRAQGLTRTLTGPELAAALGHIARHRGFRSNSKRDRSANASDETSKMLKAIAGTQERLGQYATVGTMFATDPAFKDRKRNRDGNFDRSIMRADLEHEVHAIFLAQRRLGNKLATEDLETAFAHTAFWQRPLQDSESLLAPCPFEPTEKRTARRCYSFEMFRLLSRLRTLPLSTGGKGWNLSAEQIALVAANFGQTKDMKGITYRSLRKTLDLDPRTRFVGITDKDETKDCVARSGAAAPGTYALRQIVGEAGWRGLMSRPEQRDRIAEVITFREDPGSIRLGLEQAGVEPLLVEAIMDGVASGKFSDFTGAGHISAKAARALLPGLARGLVYSEACEEVGYNHAEQQVVEIKDIRNPVARKALCEMWKQVRAIIREHGLPDAIHVELARDIGKGVEERDKITKGIEDRNKARDKLRNEFVELLRREPNLDEIIRFELWKEQGGRCLYTDDPIDPGWLISSDNRVQTDHILPWSRFGDDSFANKTLCTAAANQAKKGRTPFEWFEADGLDWAAFAARVEGCKEMKGRKKGGFYLRRNAAEVEERFRSRNLNDTRYATRVLLGLLKRLYPDDGKVHVFARPGQLTSKLRRAWGLEDLKKGPDGKRLADDRHHALDAIVVAATTESALQQLTKAAQEAERRGDKRGFDFSEAPPPAAGFREVVRDVIKDVFVARAERRRARGEAHAATIKQVREVNGVPIVFERKAVEKLTLADLERIPTPEPYGKVADPGKLRDEMVTALKGWIDAGKPKNEPPRSPKGDLIRKVRLATTDKLAVKIRGGTADRGDMARVDVFSKADKRGRRQFYLVPIYPHQVADRGAYPAPPNRAVISSVKEFKDENEWTIIDSGFDFKFSLYAASLIEITKSDGEVILGYFKGLHRRTGAVAIAPHYNQRDVRGGIGAKTVRDFRKLAIDRLGEKALIHSEVRTWHGEVCT
jgi:CRISPR-associated endonuclease Csn1